MRHLTLAVLIILVLSMATGCGGGGDDDPAERTEPTETVEIDQYVCTDEAGQALTFTAITEPVEDIPTLWDGTPFVVDISSVFPNADELLDVVTDEADGLFVTRLRRMTGREIETIWSTEPIL